MFYSQFILAKKGPLGTIWIAAHLERKLRKNQVADTDIGVSVDSIICPEVPIALRLSSHLMLGVVRIYSRKVNYLFDDCSDALLKIKQAFRSVAVDLPPEESTAPYHSITLPETFDLDDFELPDAVFDGNYVDHHVSTREQITLQDTMNGAVFSTTQFGLDERFGDGDASQIGLDLDEELFLEKSRTIQNSSIAPEKNNADIEPDTPLAVMDVDDGQNSFVHHDHNIPETTKDLPNAYGYNIRTPDLNLMVSSAEGTGDIPLPPNTIDPSFLDSNSTMGNHFDHAQAPQTPGLLEEAVPVHAQEMPDMCQLDKPFASDDVEEVARGELEWQHKQTPKNDALPLLPECSVGIMGGTAESVRVDNDEKLGTSQNEVLSSENVGIKHDCTVIIPQEALMDATPSGTEETLTLKTSVGEIIGNRDSSILTDNKPVHVGLSNMGNTVLSHNDKPEMHNHSFQEPAVHANSSVTDSYTPISNFLLRPSFTANPTHSSSLENCSLSYNNPPSRGEMVSEVNTPDVTGLLMKEQGAGFHSVNLLDTETNMHRNLQSGSLNSALNKEYDLPATSACIPIENPNCSASSKYPDPERALQAGINEHGFQRGMEHLRVEKMVPASLGSSPLNKEFVLPATAASVQSQNLNYSASSRYPDPQSVLRASVNEHGFQRGTEQLRVEKPVPVSLDISPVNKDYVLPATSASIQIENLNYSASSKYPTPERVPQTGFNEHGLQRGMEHFRVEKTVPASFNSSPLNKEYVLPATSASIQIENLNYSASSVYPEPQRMLRANSSEHAMQHGMEQSRVVAPVSLGNSPLHKEYLLPSSSGFVPMENRNYSAGSGYLQPEGMLPATANQHGLGRDLEQARAMATASLENSPFHRGYVLPATSVGIQTENLNCSASSEYPEPERMLRATFSEHHLQWNMGQSTVEKVVTESIGSVDRLNTLSGKKRRLMDSSPTLLNESSMTMPMAPSSNKNISGIANDEDLLASILVGRTTPPLNVKSTPTLPVIPSSKRARQNTKMGAPKRKVLLDDTMVLHADTIRQQLTSTEDIRRVRKKAPCSRSDIWRIQKCLLEEELFGESTLTGISDKLTLLHYRVYNMNDMFRPRVESNPSPAHISKEQTQRHVSEEQTRRHVSEEQTRRHVSEEQTQRHVSEEQTQRQVTEELTQTKTPSADANLEVTDASVMNDIIDNSVNLKYPDAHNFVHEKNSDFFEKPFANELRQNGDENVEIASHQSNGLGSIASEPHDSERHNMSLNNGVISGSDQHNESGSLLTDKNNTKEPSVATIDDLSLPPEQNSSMLSDLTANKVVDFCSADNSNNTENIVTATKSRNDQYNEIRSSLTEKNNVTEPSVAIVDGPSLSPEPHSSMPPGFTAEQPDKFRTAGNLNISESIASVPESIDDSVIVPSHTLDADINTSVKMDSLDNHDVLPCQLPPESATNYEAMEVELGARRNDQFESSCPTEDNQHVTSCQLESETVLENAVLMVEEACSDKEVDVGVPALAESHDGEDTGDSWDGGDPVDDEDDSGYLNVDDEVDFDDESNYDVPNPEEAQSQENSGWSARTRGVARYLKLLFDEDTGRTRHVVALDRLLAGKTRKEASRMFFETLVLKTKDYIHVEQEQSFANIDIKPKPKLLKLEF